MKTRTEASQQLGPKRTRDHLGHEKARQGQRGWLSANESKFATSYAQHLAVDSVKLWSSSLSLASPLAVSQAGNKGLGMVWLICSTLCSQTAHRRGGKSCSCSGVSWKCRTRVKCEGDPEHGGIFLGFHGNQGEHGTLKQHTHTHEMDSSTQTNASERPVSDLP